MGNHHGTGNRSNFIIDSHPMHGRHRSPVGSGPVAGAPHGRHRAPAGTGPVKVVTVAAATGAILVGGTQLGAATATAVPIHLPGLPPLEIPDVLLPAGVQLPAVNQAPAVVPVPPAFQAPPADVVPQVAPVPNPLGSLQSNNPIPARTVQPVSGTLTSHFGPRWGTQHGGLDIAAPIGTPIQAATDGTVISAGPASGFGLWVRVQDDDGTTTVYGHINEFLVDVGQQVAAGQQIATVGNRGQSTGPHLHFEVTDPSGQKIDPAQWLQERGVSPTWNGDSH
ncbi:M23 family metallopeptidase [Rhodococcus daqingensis]|uniref:M23 family metallopeptidase n=1 Tax=Rhodococcus daqingensis TaxID=2479363 RepID=A0ABW2RYB1_9NOCA